MCKCLLLNFEDTDGQLRCNMRGYVVVVREVTSLPDPRRIRLIPSRLSSTHRIEWWLRCKYLNLGI